MSNLIEDVAYFTEDFDLPISKVISYPSIDRMDLIAEEYDELLIAYARRDLPGVLDSLVDLTYVIIGSAIQANLPFEDAWNLVHIANMEKIRGNPDDHHQGVAKPEGWVSPNIERLIRDAIDKY